MINDTHENKNVDDILNKYYEMHKYCPKCGGLEYSKTYVTFLFRTIETYKDLNICVCSKCNNKHTVHDRVENRTNKNNLNL